MFVLGGGLSDSYVSVSDCKIEKEFCHSNTQRLKASQGLMAMRGRQVCKRACRSVCKYVCQCFCAGRSK